MTKNNRAARHIFSSVLVFMLSLANNLEEIDVEHNITYHSRQNHH